MRVLVTGGRKFKDLLLLAHAVTQIQRFGPITAIIHGGATGADALANEIAAARGIPIEVYHPNWRLLGNRAGIARNAQMLTLSKPDLVLAMPGGTGTAHMVAIARANRTPVIVCSESDFYDWC